MTPILMSERASIQPEFTILTEQETFCNRSMKEGVNRKYSVGSLFAGIGGICQAFKDASCQVLWANEFDDFARETYRLNHGDVQLVEPNDIAQLRKRHLSHVDILTAGFPCQPFSQAGRASGFKDPRGKLFFHVARLLNELRPRAYLLENVKTIVKHDDGKTFKIVRQKIKNSGYSFIPFVLNSSHYVDVPQGRERIYIVGFLDESEYSFAKPVKVNDANGFPESPYSTCFQIPQQFIGPRRSFREFLEPATALEIDYYKSTQNIIHKRVRDVVIDPNTVYQYRRWFVRANKSNVCPTLTANMGLGGHNIPIIMDEVPRRLSPKECFNLQGFRRDFRLPENMSRTQLYRQAGNSVVVPMVHLIAEEIVRVLDENGSR